jgi:hypothetical protein
MSAQARDEFLEAVPQEAVLEVSKGRATAAVIAASTAAQSSPNQSQSSSPASSAATNATAQQVTPAAAAAAAATTASSNTSTTNISGGFVSIPRNVTGGSLSMTSGGMDLSGMNGMSVGV